MKISTMVDLLGAEVLCCEENVSRHVYTACGCDLMSDVLAYVKDQAVLLTGLVNPQVIRTAEMMDIVCIIFVRGKRPDPAMMELSEEMEIPLIATPHRMFSACGILYETGLRGGEMDG